MVTHFIIFQVIYLLFLIPFLLSNSDIKYPSSSCVNSSVTASARSSAYLFFSSSLFFGIEIITEYIQTTPVLKTYPSYVMLDLLILLLHTR
ncbi:hypothetical protein CKR_1767 [Clostridium kluyveri NBRC 12016]|uniref:Uncharacterized protein n=2 Tax=Clostridium kluyveri TaxID=1534 RepID=A5MYT8_CLOK5|nr:Hypothetical protein CKL_2022 [Clostridium kluyveri DSM 555]BAH06818.1 hypothetical protein CKR_1767 [Clostridium kluyveri NBRC 12016]